MAVALNQPAFCEIIRPPPSSHRSALSEKARGDHAMRAITITPDQVEYELDISDGRTLRFRDECLTAWHEARAARMGDE
jgi:hypothetical protein